MRGVSVGRSQRDAFIWMFFTLDNIGRGEQVALPSDADFAAVQSFLDASMPSLTIASTTVTTYWNGVRETVIELTSEAAARLRISVGMPAANGAHDGKV